MDFKNIYNNQLYERYNDPRHKVMLQEYMFESGIYNPSCGDKVSFQVMLSGDTISQIGYVSEGCVISGGSADLLADFFLGKKITDVLSATKEDVFSIIGMQLGPNRLRCAFITLEALQVIAQQYKGRR